jgi:SRSO17 transposase
MVRIGRFPPFGKRFFRQARKLIGRCNFRHFWRVVTALAAMQGRRSLQRIEKMLGKHRTRQAIAYFLNHALWNAPRLLRQTALETLQRLHYRPGELIYVLLDDTQKRKRGRRMQAVSKLFLHAEKIYARGHTVLSCALVYRGVIIPYAVALWAAEAFCAQTQKEDDPQERVTFRKLTQMAADLLTAVVLPAGARAIVLFDSYYLCPTVTAACQETGWPFISVAKKNRTFAPEGRPRDRRKLGTYGRNVLQRCGRWQSVGGKRHRLAERVGCLSKAGRVKLVFSQRPRERTWVALVTNETRWGPQTVLRHYLHRWPIEVLFKMSKQYLGLGDYQVLRYRGVVRYLHLVLIAYLLLTHLGVTAPDAQAAVQGRGELRLPSVPHLQEQLRHALWDDALSSMAKGTRYRAAARKLKEIIML